MEQYTYSKCKPIDFYGHLRDVVSMWFQCICSEYDFGWNVILTTNLLCVHVACTEHTREVITNIFDISCYALIRTQKRFLSQAIHTQSFRWRNDSTFSLNISLIFYKSWLTLFVIPILVSGNLRQARSDWWPFKQYERKKVLRRKLLEQNMWNGVMSL